MSDRGMGRPRVVRRAVELRQAVAATRAVDPQTVAALEQRWQTLPEHVRTPAQTLGRHAVGCEGTHGMFPRCNLPCTPCYHSREANRVRVDGRQTLDQVRAQMRLLRCRRGPYAHAQLIGGEVSLRPPDGHAETLLATRAQGREPRSMSHGDIDADYLTALMLGPDGRPRLPRVYFAGHFDMLMFGRRGIERPPDETPARVLARHPSVAVTFTGWLGRELSEVGISRLVGHHRIRPITFVMHSFMDAADVTAAWQALQAGTASSDPRIFAAQQRLQACSYAMAHPETGQLVPARVQHSVLDPTENATLRHTLPLPTVRARAKS